MSYDDLLTVRNSLIGILKKIDDQVQVDEDDTALEVLDLIKENFKSGSGGDGGFIVTFTNNNSTVTANKTFDEILAAIEEGKSVAGLYVETYNAFYLPVVSMFGGTDLYFYCPQASIATGEMIISTKEIRMNSNNDCYIYEGTEIKPPASLCVTLEESGGEYFADFSYMDITDALDFNILVYVTFGDIKSYYYVAQYESGGDVIFMDKYYDDTITLSNNNEWSRAM